MIPRLSISQHTRKIGLFPIPRAKEYLILLLTVMMASCSKPTEFTDFTNPYDEQGTAYIAAPDLNTVQVHGIRALEAWSGGEFANDYGKPVTAKGVCWSIEENPTTGSDCTNEGSGLDAFESHLAELEPDQSYYVRAYATNDDTNIYGEQWELKTKNGQAEITISEALNVSLSSAEFTIEIINDGGAAVTDRGICWSTSQNPTNDDSCTSDGSGLGSFTRILNNLNLDTRYYVRAYATNSVGTSYGDQREFTTRDGIAQVSTDPVSDIFSNLALSGGSITDDGGASITARGVCWSASQNPTTDDRCTNNGSGTGSFSSNLTNLIPDTKYYIRAYATNSEDTVYGNQLSFKTKVFECGNIIFDVDSNEYSTIQIGEQCWMAENLRTSKFIDGSEIKFVENNSEWANMNNAAWSFYNNDDSLGEVYGKLYNYQAVRGDLCPSGWKVAGEFDWNSLEKHLGLVQSQNPLSDVGIRGANNNIGGKLKTTGTQYWRSPNSGAINSTNFSALPGGYRDRNGSFRNLGQRGYWWSESYISMAWRELHYNSSGIARGWNVISRYGYSARCVTE